jgi:hypothetical protein
LSDDDGGVELVPFFWLPKENLIDRQQRDKVDYAAWARAGLLDFSLTATQSTIGRSAQDQRTCKVYTIKEIAH